MSQGRNAWHQFPPTFPSSTTALDQSSDNMVHRRLSQGTKQGGERWRVDLEGQKNVQHTASWQMMVGLGPDRRKCSQPDHLRMGSFCTYRQRSSAQTQITPHAGRRGKYNQVHWMTLVLGARLPWLSYYYKEAALYPQENYSTPLSPSITCILLVATRFSVSESRLLTLLLSAKGNRYSLSKRSKVVVKGFLSLESTEFDYMG